MRKYLLLLISLGIILGLFWSFPVKLRPELKVVEPAKQQVTLVLDFGQGAKKEEKVGAVTAFEALRAAAREQNLELKTKQYDFGIFVESIGGVENSKERAWIYFVNDKAGEVASDKYTLKAGDVVEWKYTVPIF
ncbi:DUF4430 domain-containing protein [Candidatus Gottesmanbacteria bacterium]|nr:DUF4430 domain-containing protein [Candidatus Gottesmanbacteria bacterium]